MKAAGWSVQWNPGNEKQTTDVYTSAPHSPWPPVSLSHSVNVSTNRLMRETFSLQAFPSVFFHSFIFHRLSLSSSSSSLHILSSLCKIYSVHTESTGLCSGFDLCFCMRMRASDSVFVLCMCVLCAYMCVFLYLPRLGIKCQSRRLMFSPIERHSSNESIELTDGNRKTHLKETYRISVQNAHESMAHMHRLFFWQFSDTLPLSFSTFLTSKAAKLCVDCWWSIFNIGWDSMREHQQKRAGG